HDDVDFVVVHQLQALVGAARFQHPEFAAQEIVYGIAHVHLVIDHQQRVFCRWVHGWVLDSFKGRWTRKQVPSPGLLSTSMRPPCPVMMPCEIDRPNPVPSPTGLVVKNGSKSRGRTWGSMPQPLSAISMSN